MCVFHCRVSGRGLTRLRVEATTEEVAEDVFSRLGFLVLGLFQQGIQQPSGRDVLRYFYT